GEWRVDVTAAKPRLQMHHRNLAVEGRNRGSHDCRRVTLHDDRVGSVLFEDGVDLRDDTAGNGIERLPVRREVEVYIGDYVEDRVDLVEDLKGLGCNNDNRGEIRVSLERLEHWCHPDGFRTSTINDHHFGADARIVSAQSCSFVC